MNLTPDGDFKTVNPKSCIMLPLPRWGKTVNIQAISTC